MMKMNRPTNDYPILTNYFSDEVFKASELVKLLQDLIAEHGDYEVKIGITDDRPMLRFADMDVLDA
jgi:hypothetical protein